MQTEQEQNGRGTPIVYRTETDQLLYCPETALRELAANDLPEICVVTSGSGIHQLLEQAIPCREGDVYIVAPAVPHGFYRTSPDAPLTVRRILFDPASLPDPTASQEDGARYCYGVFRDNALAAYAMLNAKTREEVDYHLHAIERETAEHSADWQEALGAHLTLLLITLARYVGSAIKNLPHLPPKEWSIALAALRAVNERYAETELTLEAIAAELYVSQSTLSRLFKRLCGKSFTEHLKDLRLSRACELLQSSTLTVDGIVRACGLRDLPSFYHAFQAHTGMTPHQYRIQQNPIQKQKRLGENIMSILNEMSEALQKGRAKLVKDLVEKALAEGCDPENILDEGLLAGMNIIGEKFKNNEVYVPEVLVAARAMNMGTQILKPYLVANGVTARGRACIGTVQGDLHDIGKNLVRMMLESKGIEVIDLGVDVPAEKFVETAKNENCQIICCSALLTTTMAVMKDVVAAAEAAGIRNQVKIMIGGAPVNEAYRAEIGADCYTSDAASAADAAAAFCKE